MSAQKITPENIRNKLKFKALEEKENLFKKHPHVRGIFKLKSLDLGKIRQHSAKILSSGAIAGALLINPPTSPKFLPTPTEVLEDFEKYKKSGEKNSRDTFIGTIKNLLPLQVRPLDISEEKLLEQIFFQVLKVPAKAGLEGEHLNTVFGYIGYEQHLRRYPGDVLQLHGDVNTIKAGMAPGLGAWNYFAKNKEEMTTYLEDIEKWYAVVQTLYLPDWNTRQPYLKNWYKYRKVLIVNTENGNAVIASIADSGPAAWTGKHFGGSPEVMNYLGGERYRKGKVLVFFVDDPENEISLGPWKY